MDAVKQARGKSAARAKAPGAGGPETGAPGPSWTPKRKPRLRLPEAPGRGPMLVLHLLVAGVILGAWQYSTDSALLNAMLYSSPEQIFERIQQMAAGQEVYGRTIYDHILTTLKALAIGYLIGAPTAALAGFLLGRSKLAAEVLEPFILVFFAIPKISLAPLFVIIFSTGLASKVAIVTIEVFFIVFYSTLRGVLEVNEDFVRLAKVMGAGRWSVLKDILLPASLPSIVAGLRLAVPFAMIGAILGEYIASNQGLGWLVLYFGSTLDATGLFATLMFLLMVVALLEIAVAALAARAVPWQPKRGRASGHRPVEVS